MIINVKNLGVIANGEINSVKPLILMCGPNSTGKTYMSYLLYAIFSNQYRIVPQCFNAIGKLIDERNEFIIKKEYIDDFLVAESEAIKFSMNSIYGLAQDANKSLFRYFRLSMTITDEFYQKNVIGEGFSMDINIGGNDIKIQKEAKSDVVKFEIISSEGNIKFSNIPMYEYLIFSVMRFCAHSPIMGARMLTVERNSIYTFNTELSLSRNELIDRLLDVKRSESSLADMVNNGSQRYPLAIRESLRVANDLETIQKRKSPYFEFAAKIEAELLHGVIGVNKTGSVEFMPETSGKQVKRLPIHMTSSVVKTLSSLIIYLKHLAKKHDLVIIDEPEMNLHPDNQRLLARLFARLVNKGIRLVISTHSDYIIREFNNVVMAHELFGNQKSIADSELSYDKSELLDRKKIDVLYFQFNKKGKVEITNVPLDKYGFNIESIDDTINLQNDITQNLFDSLRYGKSNE